MAIGREDRIAIMARWDKARDEYKREASLMTRIRLSMPARHLRSAQEIVEYELATQRFKAACKRYYAEREVMQLSLRDNAKEEQLDEAVAKLAAIIKGTPTAEIPTAAEIKREGQIRDSLLETGDFDTIRQAALAAIKARGPKIPVGDDSPFVAPPIDPEDRIEDFGSDEDEDEVESPEEIIRKYGVPSPEGQDVKPEEAA